MEDIFEKIIRLNSLFGLSFAIVPSLMTENFLHRCKTAGKWQKCNLVSGMASVASDMGWL